ncbi:serine/threonine-protein kinase VRK1-like [Octopus sinensis]|uniref:Serine/threonine-protein kinase VRK1-like n=1 Tax=Octopus sinensis TaxID=2607531 RepID=A0A6P7TS22_9MOLL|nr:serine/threonine-protein kinase VRK1-like [Octopus sinensis]
MPRSKRKVDKSVDEMEIGEILTDASNVSWCLGPLFAKGGFGFIHTAHMNVGLLNNSYSQAKYVIKLEANESGPLFCEKQVYIRALNENNC